MKFVFFKDIYPFYGLQWIPAMSSAKKTASAKVRIQNSSQKRRNRRKKAQNSHTEDEAQFINAGAESKPKQQVFHLNEASVDETVYYGPCNCPDCTIVKVDIGTMTNDPVESREKIKAAREAKKLAKQQAKMKRDAALDIKQPAKALAEVKKEETPSGPSTVTNKDISPNEQAKELGIEVKSSTKELAKDIKSNDEVDRATVTEEVVGQVPQGIEPGKDQIKTERAAKKAAKQAKKKGVANGDVVSVSSTTTPPKADTEMTVRDVVETLRDIKIVAQEVKEITAQVQALNLDKKKPEKKTVIAPNVSVQEAETADLKPTGSDTQASDATPKETVVPTKSIPSKGTLPQSEEGGKSKAELKAERRAKQEAQRAAKEAAAQAKAAAAKPKEQNIQPEKEASKTIVAKEKSPKPKTPGKQNSKQQGHRVNWFRHLYNDDDKAKLNKLPINSNLHPAIIKLGVQLATRVVSGSNARCIALLDALKKMVRDYSLPAKTEFGRGLDAHLATSLEFLWSMRQPTASQTNAVKFFRHHLTQLPNNVDEFDAKKTLQEEIDRYIREQIEMAGEAISITVRNKISTGDHILTYGCSSLIERILVDAHNAGVQFHAVVCGGGVAARAASEMTRRLTARGVPCLCIDISALSFVMRSVNKVLLGASSLLANGSVLAAAGTATAALVARAFNKPVLVACETHKFSERVQTDAFVYNEIGDPDDLIDKSDENSPLKDWRSNPNLTPLNLTYDVTPPHLITAVVTELAILPCTSAPVVLRFKLSEYSI